MLPEVNKTYNLTKDLEGCSIAGASSRAISACTVAWERPDQFRKVISLIGGFTNIRGGDAYLGEVRETERKPIRVFIQDGVLDHGNPRDASRDWHLRNRAMVAALKQERYGMPLAFGEGGHSDDHGDAILPDILRRIWRHDPK